MILLAGVHRGKRVVFLKQLASGLLLVTGPYKCNGVPLRRACQSSCIATSTKVDISGVNVPDNINDAYFKRAAAAKKTEEGIFEQKEAGYNVSYRFYCFIVLFYIYRLPIKEKPTKKLLMLAFLLPSLEQIST